MSCGCVKREEIERVIDDLETQLEGYGPLVMSCYLKKEDLYEDKGRVEVLKYCIQRLKELVA